MAEQSKTTPGDNLQAANEGICVFRKTGLTPRQLQQQRDELRQALERFGQHDRRCDAHIWGREDQCTCGLSQALANTAPNHPGP